jgi:uncharacterized SAM-binding protein YcdF (DUF218 family)
MIRNRSKVKAILLLTPTAALLTVFLLPMSVRIINHGNVLGAVFCLGVILLWTVFPIIKQSRMLMIAFRILLGLIVAGFIWAMFLSVNMIVAMRDTPPVSDDSYTVIVLGCHVQNGVPSTMLTSRLKTAKGYLQENEAVMAVTTGGYGVGQRVSEAETGKNWLVHNEICESRIFLEDRSTSTLENLLYARVVVGTQELPRNIVIVSDGFHLWRAKLMAEDLEKSSLLGISVFEEIYVIPAPTTPPHLIPTYWVREWFALTYYFAMSTSTTTLSTSI